MNKKLILLFTFLLITGTLIAQLNFIPSWKVIGGNIFVSIFGLAVIILIIYLIRHWRNNYRNSASLKGINWVKSVAISIGLISLFAVLFFINILKSSFGFMDPTFEKEYSFGDRTIYQYYNSCWPPDGECECHDYYSLIYIKNKFLPTMSLLKQVDFYVGDVKFIAGKLMIEANDKCEKDRGKMVEVMLE